jgi:hypothetical protein
MNTIVQKSCDCLEEINSTDPKQIELELGMCIINSSQPYAKELKRDFDIDMSNLNVAGEKLGETVGIKMAGVCPNSLFALAQKMEGEDVDVEMEFSEKVSAKNTFEGQILMIKDFDFVQFTVKNNTSGELMVFYWLYEIKSNEKIKRDYRSLQSKNVKITYSEKMIFNPNTGNYENYNIIERLDTL